MRVHMPLDSRIAMQDRVMRSIALDMPLDELSTYQLMWQLQPYLQPHLIQEVLAY